MNTQEASKRAGLLAVLVALALLLALQLPSSGFTGSGPSPVDVLPTAGQLLVSVALNNESSLPTPMKGVQVAISQPILHGLHLVLPTNGTGEVELTLPAGTYGVSVSNGKFALSSDVPVNSTGLTWMHVLVNRTSYLASFAEAQDSTSQGEIEPWNTVVVEVTPYQFLFPVVNGNPRGQQIIIGSVLPNPSPPTFNGSLYIQPYYFPSAAGAGLVGGTEVPMTVVSQVARSGGTWLTLRPDGLLQLAGALYVQVVSYQAGSSVSFENA